MPRTCKVASWEPNEVYEVLHETSVISEEGQEETFNRFLKPAAPPDSGNGVVVPHVHVCMCMCMCMYVHACACMYMHVCTCMCMYVHACSVHMLHVRRL